MTKCALQYGQGTNGRATPPLPYLGIQELHPQVHVRFRYPSRSMAHPVRSRLRPFAGFSPVVNGYAHHLTTHLHASAGLDL